MATDDIVITFDPALAGRRVQADGGADASRPGDTVSKPSREQFEGLLTGRRLAQGDPPWYFLELGDLVEKPEGFEEERVWCDESYVYFMD